MLWRWEVDGFILNLFRMQGLGGATFSSNTSEAGSGRALQIQVQPGLHNEALSLKMERQTDRQAIHEMIEDELKHTGGLMMSTFWSTAKKEAQLPSVTLCSLG